MPLQENSGSGRGVSSEGLHCFGNRLLEFMNNKPERFEQIMGPNHNEGLLHCYSNLGPNSEIVDEHGNFMDATNQITPENIVPEKDLDLDAHEDNFGGGGGASIVKKKIKSTFDKSRMIISNISSGPVSCNCEHHREEYIRNHRLFHLLCDGIIPYDQEEKRSQYEFTKDFIGKVMKTRKNFLKKKNTPVAGPEQVFPSADVVQAVDLEQFNPGMIRLQGTDPDYWQGL